MGNLSRSGFLLCSRRIKLNSNLFSCPQQARAGFAMFCLRRGFASSFSSRFLYSSGTELFSMLFWRDSPAFPRVKDPNFLAAAMLRI
jgi:hypothetical protein